MANKFYKVIAENRRARFDYYILETFQAGIMLSGSEVKSVRMGRVNLHDSFGRVEKGGVFLYNMHITPYEKSGVWASEAKRKRKLLLNKQELRKVVGRVTEKGLTLVPLKVYFSGDWLKVGLAVCKAKKKFGKKLKLIKKTVEREVERELRKREL